MFGKIKSWHIGGLVLLLSILALGVYAYYPILSGENSDNERPEVDKNLSASANIDAIIIENTDFALRSEATGHLAPWRKTEVSAEIGGRLIRRNIDEGQAVAYGQILFALDDTEYEIAVREASDELLKLQADYAVRRNQDISLPTDTTRLSLARMKYQEAKRAYQSGDLSEALLNEARRTFEAEEIIAGKRREAMRAATTGVAQAEHRKERASLNLQRTKIKAPFGGRVTDLTVEVGQQIGAGQKLFTLLDDSKMKVEVDVLESDLVNVSKGSTARVRIPALENQVFNGTVFSINPAIDPQSGTGRVTVLIPNPDRSLLSGLFAYVELETDRLQNRVVIPTDAVLVRQGRDLVFKIEEGKAKWVYVTLGSRSGNQVEVIEGVLPGDTLAVSGHFALAHDAPVTIQNFKTLPQN